MSDGLPSPYLTPPERIHHFETGARHDPRRTVPPDRLDAQFNQLIVAIKTTQNALKRLLRSDGQLQNGIVRPETLDPNFKDNLLEDLTREIEEIRENVRSIGQDVVIQVQTAEQAAKSAKTDADWVAKTTARTQNRVEEVLRRAEVAKIVALEAETRLSETQSALLARATVLEQDGASAGAYAQASKDWAEHMGGTLPAESVAVMDLTGDHWSSRWWANRAAEIVGEFALGGPAVITVSDTPPVTTTPNQLWWESDTGALYLRYNDGNSLQWVEIGGSSIVGGGEGGGGGGGGIPEAPIDGVTYGRKDTAWSPLDLSTTDWGEITGKPSTFPPSGHSHPISDVIGLQPALDLRAPLLSPIFSGDPTAPTPPALDDSTRLATTQWVRGYSGGGSGAAITVSDTAPSSPVDNQLWWESDTGAMYIRYNDGTSTQWVSVIGPAGPSPGSGGGEGGGTPGGADTQIQFNDGGAFGTTTKTFGYNKTDGYLTVGAEDGGGGAVVVGDLSVTHYAGVPGWGQIYFGDEFNCGIGAYDGVLSLYSAVGNTVTVDPGGHPVWHRGNYGSKTVSTDAPSGGVNGDIWFQVE